MAGISGQWLGRYTGVNSGTLIIELDDMGTHYEGRTFAYDDNQALPSSFAVIQTANKDAKFHLNLLLYPVHPRTGGPTTWNEVASLFPGINFPTSASIDFEATDVSLTVSWTTNIGTTGSAHITRKTVDAPSDCQPLSHVTKWEEFKSYVCDLDHRRYIFRGQSKLLRLRTFFHRTGRADLARFLDVDIPTLHRHLSLRTTHVFNRSIPEENGAFFNLVQHHGYPTPLLDWTFSPFVAAFFAYHRLTNSKAALADAEKSIRILQFDQSAWKARFPQIEQLTWTRPHFSIMEFIAMDNQRMIPQQSISSVTNIDDIETYIRSLEISEGQYLKVIDLPVKERPIVMKELSVMGITAGSLFPGLDGTCEELRERFFNL